MDFYRARSLINAQKADVEADPASLVLQVTLRRRKDRQP